MKNSPEQTLRDALSMTGLLNPIKSAGRGGHIELLCRQIPGQEAGCLRMVDTLLHLAISELKSEESIFIARKYLLKDDKMVYGWYLKVEMPSAALLRSSIPKICEALKALKQDGPSQSKPRPVAKNQVMRVTSSSQDEEGNVVEVTEMEIPHAPKNRNVPTKPIWSAEHGRFIGGGKGAAYTGKQ